MTGIRDDARVHRARRRIKFAWSLLLLIAGIVLLARWVLGLEGGWQTDTFAGNQATSLAVDREGRVWAGAYGALNVREQDGSWTTYETTAAGDPIGGVLSLAPDERNRMWIGTDNGLLVFGGNDEWERYTTANSGLAGDEVIDVVVDGEQRVWTSTPNGVSVYDPSHGWKTFTLSAPAPYTQGAFDFALDSDEQVWGITYHGVSLLTPDGPTVTYEFPEEVTFDRRFLALDSRDRMWVWHAKGVYKIEEGVWTWHGGPGTVMSGSVLFVDSRDRIWQAYSSGVRVHDSTIGRWQTYRPTNSGLASSHVFAFAEAGDGAIWIATGRGLNRYDAQNPLPGSIVSGLTLLQYLALVAAGVIVVYVVDQIRRVVTSSPQGPALVPEHEERSSPLWLLLPFGGVTTAVAYMRRKSRWRMLTRWMLASTVAGMILLVFILLGLLILFSAFMSGMLDWGGVAVASMAGIILLTISSGLQALVVPKPISRSRWLVATVASTFLFGMFPIGQYIVLRRHFTNTWRWIVVSILGLLVGLVSAVLVTIALRLDDFGSALVIGGGTGLGYSVTTGLYLLRLLDTRRHMSEEMGSPPHRPHGIEPA